jgi:hypothetical protein
MPAVGLEGRRNSTYSFLECELGTGQAAVRKQISALEEVEAAASRIGRGDTAPKG